MVHHLSNRSCNCKLSIQIPILGLHNILDALIAHFIAPGKPVKVLRVTEVLDMNHDDLLHARFLLQLFYVSREHVIGTDDLHFLGFGIAAP